MGNYLQMSTQQQVRALLDLGWSHRRIARELGVHRETVGRYARLEESKPANPITVCRDRRSAAPGPTLIGCPLCVIENEVLRDWPCIDVPLIRGNTSYLWVSALSRNVMRFRSHSGPITISH